MLAQMSLCCFHEAPRNEGTEAIIRVKFKFPKYQMTAADRYAGKSFHDTMIADLMLLSWGMQLHWSQAPAKISLVLGSKAALQDLPEKQDEKA